MFLTVVGEARGEPVEGQIAVANVIMNRAKTRGPNIKEVCLAPKQFSCWNPGDPNRKLLDDLAQKMMEGSYAYDKYKQIQWIVDGIITGKLTDNTKGKDHYMTTALYHSVSKPSWARVPKGSPVEIGNHTFLNV